MQTFLTYKTYQKTAKSLDNRRLGKQRVETYQILKALSNPSYGWQNHPAVKMWRGYETSLINYGIAICQEWRSRGYKDTCLEKIESYKQVFNSKFSTPYWISNKLIRSHRSNLIRKMPDYYSKQWKNVPDTLEYFWPVK